MKRKVVSFLVSGRGSNFRAIAEAIQLGEIHASLGVVVSNVDKVAAFDTAERLGIPYYFVDPKQYASREEHERKIDEIFSSCSTDLVCSAGYMRLISPYLIERYRNRIMNIHPALLPSFPGINAQRQALEYGVKFSGCTVHFVDEGTDTGPIILQRVVPVADDDTEETLSQRILEEEHSAYREAVCLFCGDRISIMNRTVVIGRG